MHAFYALVGTKKDRRRVMSYLFALEGMGEFDYFDEDSLNAFTGKEAKDMNDLYCLVFMDQEYSVYYSDGRKAFYDTLKDIEDDWSVWKVDVKL